MTLLLDQSLYPYFLGLIGVIIFAALVTDRIEKKPETEFKINQPINHPEQMKTVVISTTERVIITRSGNETTAQLQHRLDSGWETVHRKAYKADWKGKIVEHVLADYRPKSRPAEDFVEVDIDPYN
jgi:hypothetical protein